MGKLSVKAGLLGVSMTVMGVVGFISSLQMPIFEKYTLGPGGAPIFYSTVLIIMSILFLKTSPPQRKGFSIRDLFSVPVNQGFLYLGLLFITAGLIHLFGFLIMMLVMTFAGLVLVEKWRIAKALVFSAVWAGMLYLLFVRLLKVTFI